MSLVTFGIGLTGAGGGSSGFIAVDSVIMEVDMPDILLVYQEDEILLVVEDDTVSLILDDEDVELEVD